MIWIKMNRIISIISQGLYQAIVLVLENAHLLSGGFSEIMVSLHVLASATSE